MIRVLSREAVRALDRLAIDVAEVPGIVLMENAGRGAADAIAAWLEKNRPGGLAGARIVVVAGRGNNGGDGCVVARHLALRGAEPTVLLAAARSELTGDAALAAAALVGVGGRLVEGSSLDAVAAALAAAELVVDALFGTGLDRDLTGAAAALVALVAGTPTPVVALDLPSGLDADTGAARGLAVHAVLTVTFAHPKPGLFAVAAREYVGELVVVDIGIPPTLAERGAIAAEVAEATDVARLLPRRPAALHKGGAGRVALFAGAPGTVGAALLAARGALRAGAGLVTLAAEPEVALLLEARVLEAMTARLDFAALAASVAAATAAANAAAVGPGLGRGEPAARLVAHLVTELQVPLVIDADAISLLAADPALLLRSPAPRLLTPHAGELARLLGGSVAEVQADRLGAVARAVALTGAVVLLKGPFTVIGAPGARPVLNPTGNPALATGGSGDVLTGIAAALACHLPLREAAVAAAYLHGLAADRWAHRTGADRGLLAHEIADELPAALASLAATDPRLPV